MISAMEDKAYSINLDIIREISERANQEGWTEHQRRGVLAQDSANISPGLSTITSELDLLVVMSRMALGA